MSNGTTTGIQQGIVYKKTIANYDVYTGERTVTCALSTRLWKSITAGSGSRTSGKKNRTTEHSDPVAIGDAVQFIETENGAMIVDLLPRQNTLSRRTAVPMPGAHAFEQVIVANIDQVVPVFAAARPMPSWNMLDRYLVAAESHHLPILICITKIDLAQDENGKIDPSVQEAVDEYRRIGYQVITVSAQTGEGIADLRQALGSRVSVFVGKSGVGKTTLLNALQPGLGLKVKSVSQGKLGKGRHTTTHLEMFPLDAGGAVVDTPGVREFGLWDVEADDLALLFPEIAPHVGHCRFGLDCRHDAEPGCAVRKAVMNGQISPRRYQSYMRLAEEVEP